MKRDEALAVLRRAASELERDFGVIRIGVFGSVARDEAHAESDIDLVAEFAPRRAPGLSLFALEVRLTALLGRPARICGRHRLNPVMRAELQRDLVYA